MHTKLNELAKLRALRAHASTRIIHHQYMLYVPAYLRALLLINTHLTRLRVYTILPSLKGVLRAFVLSCVVLSQLKDKVRFVYALQLTIPPLSLSPLFCLTI